LPLPTIWRLISREHPLDFINITIEELVGGRPFEDHDRYIT